jgi:hypothetical protein
MRCLAKVREERWNDMDQFLLALKEAMGGPTSSSGQIAAMTGEWDAMKSGVMSLANTTGSGPAVKVAMGTPAYGVTPLSISSAPAPAPANSEAPRAPRSGAGMWIGALVVALGLAAGGYFLFGRPATAMPPGSTVATTDPTPPPDTGAEAPATTTGVGTSAIAPLPTTAPPTSVAPIRTVLVSLRSQPSGAMVTLGERTYGPTPTEVELTGDLAAEGAQLHFVFSRAGFRDMPMDMTVAGPTLDVNARMARIVHATATHEEGGEGGSGATGDTHVDGYRDSPY